MPNGRRRSTTKNTANYESLGNSGLGTLLNGLGTFSLFARIRFRTFSAGVNDNSILTVLMVGTTVGVAFCINGATPKLRIGARSVSPGDARQTVDGGTTLAVDTDYNVGAVIDVAGDTMELFINGVSDAGPTAVTFANAAWTLGVPTDADAIGGFRAPPVATAELFDGVIGDLAAWSSKLVAADYNSLQTSAPSAVQSGTLIWYMPNDGRASPETSLTGGLTGTITGDVPVSPSIARERLRRAA